MKRNIFMMMFLSFVFLCGCSKEPVEETKTYIIPESYFTYSGADVAESTEALIELGEEFCTSAEVVDKSMKMELTDTQRDNMIKRNNEFIDTLTYDLLSQSDEYSYTVDKTYKKLDFYFDEKADIFSQMKAVFGTATGYAMNQMLLYNTEDWNVEVTIYNCHTDKVVFHINVPSEKGSYGAEEWANSYKE